MNNNIVTFPIAPIFMAISLVFAPHNLGAQPRNEGWAFLGDAQRFEDQGDFREAHRSYGDVIKFSRWKFDGNRFRDLEDRAATTMLMGLGYMGAAITRTEKNPLTDYDQQFIFDHFKFANQTFKDLIDLQLHRRNQGQVTDQYEWNRRTAIAYKNLALTMAAFDDLRGAGANLRRAVELFPEDQSAQRYLKKVYQELESTSQRINTDLDNRGSAGNDRAMEYVVEVASLFLGRFGPLAKMVGEDLGLVGN